MPNERFNFIRTLADVQRAVQSLDAERPKIHRLRLTVSAAADASIVSSATPANGVLVTIDDAQGNVVIFEFTSGGAPGAGHVAVNKVASTTGGMAELRTEINASALTITAAAVTGAGPWTLPLAHDVESAIGNTATIVETGPTLSATAFTGGRDGNLNAAAGSQVIAFPEALPANSVVLAAVVDIIEEFDGGGASSVTADVGTPGDDDLYLAAVDVFTGAGLGAVQTPAGVGFDIGTAAQAGLPFLPAATIPQVTIAADVDLLDLEVGIADVVLLVASPPASE